MPDLCGRLGLLESLAAAIEKEAPSAGTSVRIVLLGNLFGHGPSGKELLSFLHSYRSVTRLTVLGGWREARMGAALNGDAYALSEWLEDGGSAFLESFGVEPRAIFLRRLDVVLAQASAAITHDVQSWIGALPSLHVSGNYKFVADGLSKSNHPRRSEQQIRSKYVLDAQAIKCMVSHLGTDPNSSHERVEQIGVLALEGRRPWVVYASHSAAPKMPRAILLSGSPHWEEASPASATLTRQSVFPSEAQARLCAILDTPAQPSRWPPSIGGAASAVLLAIFGWWMIPDAKPRSDVVVQSVPSGQIIRLPRPPAPQGPVAFRDAKREALDSQVQTDGFSSALALRPAPRPSNLSDASKVDVRSPNPVLAATGKEKARGAIVASVSALPAPGRWVAGAIVDVDAVTDRAPDTSIAANGERHEVMVQVSDDARKRRLAAVDAIRALRFR